MPLSLLVALFLAFGVDAIVPPAPVPEGMVAVRVVAVLIAVASVALVALTSSITVQLLVRRQGGPTSGSKRLFGICSIAVEVFTVCGYAWVIHGLGWPEVVRSHFHLRGAILLDEILILSPFLLAQLAGWFGLYFGERALWARTPIVREHSRPSIARYLVLRARQTLGMFLPSALLFSLAQDLARRFWPIQAQEAEFQLGLMAGVGMLIVMMAPAFVRLAWPTRPLPAGPVRDRLERLSRRFRFRFTDILIWDTDGMMANAGVSGALPFFRYVLLTDVLIQNLNPHEIAAVFGHEVGHIRHRHLTFFGFFFVGSLGVLTLATDLVWMMARSGLGEQPISLSQESMAQGVITLVLGIAYFALIFGILSRRFERQADVFGARAVSCGSLDCPPHPDLYSRAEVAPVQGPLCPVGIRTFANALRRVAVLNGTRTSSPSWRHGSIDQRVAFLEGLEGKPRSETRFQHGVIWLRVGLTLALISGLIVALKTGSIEHMGP